MPKIIEAVYENGVIKPLEKVEIREGERVKVIIEERIDIKKFVFSRLSEEKIKELEERFENESVR